MADRDNIRDWLKLIRTPSIGPITFHRLIAKYGSARNALDALPTLAAGRRSTKPLIPPTDDEIDQELAAADQCHAEVIAFHEDRYPRALKAIPDPPPVIFAQGALPLLDKPAIAIVGARNASSIGRKIARRLASDLGAEGIAVVSGLARGIDGAAHEAALETGTIAVVAGGVDVIYPPEHDRLTAAIAARGVVLSECPIGYRPTARDFPKRNRLISGLSRGVIVVEAAARSGTLITARLALEQGREVFAVPGSPLDPRCAGANRLIRDGAKLVETAEDVLNELAASLGGAHEDERDLFNWQARTDAPPSTEDLSQLRAAIYELLGFTPVHRDDLMREIASPPGHFADALLELVLSGAVEEHPGARFARAADNPI